MAKNAPSLHPKFGVQITGFFADPFLSTPEHCFSRSNGNEAPPPRAHGNDKLAENLLTCGAQVLIYHVNPIDWQAAHTCNNWAKLHGFSLLLNNEAGQIYGPAAEGSLAWDWDAGEVTALNQANPLYGLLHDEPFHHQIHSGIPTKTNRLPTLADTRAVTDIAEAYRMVSEGIGKLVATGGRSSQRVFTEQVIPIGYHAVARAGGVPGCKVLKEQNTTLSLTLAMSAAWQYGTSWTACIDLWEGDSGPWYQVMSKFAGHSPREFRSALEMVDALCPELFYVESADILWEADHPDAPFTEFGKELAAFSRRQKAIAAGRQPRFRLAEWQPQIAVIHPEDGAWGIGPWPRYGLLGSEHLPVSPQHLQWLKIWYHLMWGQADLNSLWAYQNPREIAIRAANLPGGDEVNTSARPPRELRRDSRRAESHAHRLFHPLNNAVILDQHFEARHLQHAELIIVAGSYAPQDIWQKVEARVREGAVCLSDASLTPSEYCQSDDRGNGSSSDGYASTHGSKQIGKGHWYTTSDFLSQQAAEIIMPYRGYPQQWRLKTASTELCFFPRDPWGNAVAHCYR